MRLGVFGGTFDPPHNGHLIGASDAYEALSLDRVLFIPNAQQPLKPDGPAASAPDRLEMVRLLCQSDPRFEVDSTEVDRGGLSFTVDTLRALHSRFAGAALFLLIGDDVAASLPSWRESETVRKLAEVVVLARGGAGPDAGSERRIATRRVDISSTEIRERLATNLPVAGFLPPAVADYIRARGLYRERTSEREGASKRTRP